MNRLAFLACALAFPGIGLADPADDGASPPAVALKGLDPVALIGGREVAGVQQFASTRGRFRYLFADAASKARFDADPARYSARSESCSVMPNVPASPDIFLVHGGELYLFGSPGCLARFREDPGAFAKPRKKVAILAYDGMELLDFAGPAEVFAGEGRAFDAFGVAAKAGPVVSLGFSITPRYTLDECPGVDVLVLPGGATRGPLADPATLAWIRKASAEAQVTISVCTGALLLAKAGLLDGLDATTHHQAFDLLADSAPKARVLRGSRFVDNGRIVTSAGVSSGIDASLHVVARLLGTDAAREAAQRMEYDPRPGNQAKPD
ncbi:MAG: DJ-1/PfpI family protein [Isosphaeraceae bacterium]